MKNSFTLNFLLFTGFLLFGYTVSNRFNPPAYSNQTVETSRITANSNSPIQILNNGQRSMLLIWVDSVETSKPELLGLWLASYLPSQSTVQFLPIYPTTDEGRSDWETSLKRSFSVNRLFNLNDKNINVVPGRQFTKFLENSNYWWSGYFIFDQMQIESIQDLFSTKNLGNQLTDNQPLLNGSIIDSAPENTVPMQYSSLQTICRNLSDLSDTTGNSQVILNMSSKVYSNLDKDQVQQEWDSLLANGAALNCEFPTIQVPVVNR